MCGEGSLTGGVRETCIIVRGTGSSVVGLALPHLWVDGWEAAERRLRCRQTGCKIEFPRNSYSVFDTRGRLFRQEDLLILAELDDVVAYCSQHRGFVKVWRRKREVSMGGSAGQSGIGTYPPLRASDADYIS